MDVMKDKLLSDLKALITDAEELVRATANQASEKVASARQRIEETLEEGRKTLADAEDKFFDGTREAVKSAEHYVRENPWNAIGIAAGIGLLLGLLIRRD